MFQYPLYFSGVLGVLLLAIQFANATESTITATSDGTTITETKQTVPGQPPVGRIAQVTDGIKSSLASGYDRLNSMSKGRVESFRTSAVSQYNDLADRVKNRVSSPRGSASAACALPTQTVGKGETVVQTTTTTQP